jgi:hypothetical protein
MRCHDFKIESIDSRVLKQHTEDDTVTIFVQVRLKQSVWGEYVKDRFQ